MPTIDELGRMIRGKKISCAELARESLAAARELNRECNAYISITDETALKAADDADSKLSAGQELPPLAGIPFVLSDNIATAGIKTTCASRMLESHVPLYDASVWESLKNQGAVLIGKGNMDELGMGSTGETSYFGPVRNPHSKEHTAGGGSCGAAAAVAAGTSIFGIGSDTGGGIRQPASFCGLVGLKPTYGAVSRNGLAAFASSLDQIGPLTGCVRDAATVFDAISFRDGRDAMSKGRQPLSPALTQEIRGMRIGVPPEFYKDIKPGYEAAMQNALRTLEKLGAVIVEQGFPLLRYALSAYYIISCAEAASNLGCFDGLRCGHRAGQYDDIDDFICRTRSEGFGAEVRRRIILGTCALSAEYYDAYFNKALMLKNAVKNEYRRLFQSCDCIVTPTAHVTAMKPGEFGLSEEAYSIDRNTASVSIAGLPAVTVPCGCDENGLPVGMQVIGDMFREDLLLNVALAFEAETAGEFGVRSQYER